MPRNLPSLKLLPSVSDTAEDGKLRRQPSEHSIAHAMKKSPDLALFEQILLVLPLDAIARRSALSTFEGYWRTWFVRQHRNGGQRKSNPVSVAIAIEALGLRDIVFLPRGAISARLPNGSQIQIPEVTGASPQRDPVDPRTARSQPLCPPSAADAVRTSL